MKRDRVYDLSRRGVLRSMIGGSILFPGIVSQLLADDAGPPSRSIRSRPSRRIFRRRPSGSSSCT